MALARLITGAVRLYKAKANSRIRYFSASRRRQYDYNTISDGSGERILARKARLRAFLMARVARRTAQTLAPRQTGALKASIQIYNTAALTITIRSKLGYAAAVEKKRRFMRAGYIVAQGFLKGLFLVEFTFRYINPANVFAGVLLNRKRPVNFPISSVISVEYNPDDPSIVINYDTTNISVLDKNENQYAGFV